MTSFAASRRGAALPTGLDALSLPEEAAVLLASFTLTALVYWGLDLLSWPRARHDLGLVTSSAVFLAVGAAGGVATLLVLTLPVRLFGLRSVTSGVRSMRIVLGAVGVAVLGVDQTVLVSLYERAHTFAEVVALLSLGLLLASLLRRAAQDVRWLRVGVRVLAAAAFAWLVVLASSRSLRRALERSLPSVWEEPVYTARWLRRMHRTEALLLRGRLGESASGLERLADKYELHGAAVDEAWKGAPVPLPPMLRPVAPSGARWNVVVFFVDTLRADVAHDPAVMPETLAWMKENIWFPRAYASGSSTVLTLVPMLGCRYDSATADAPRLLDAARASGMRTGLVIPSSASEYHREFFPAFRFDHHEVVPDVEGGRVSTSQKVVDRSLAWLREQPEKPFLLWVYDYDVHSSGDLDQRYLEEHARAAQLPRSDGAWRYRAAARGVDKSFTRLRAGLEELGLMDRTVILFVADHGEGLGQQNFWSHTTYLWESLVRVPFALHVPGRGPRRSDEPVSTVDIATTLSSFVGPLANARSCHGADLLAPTRQERLPILFSAIADRQLARVGMLAGAHRKLVVDVRDGNARLLRIQDGSAVEEDASAEEPTELLLRLNQLVRSPIYPRR